MAAANPERMREEQMRGVEAELDRTVQKARRCGLTDAEIRKILKLLWRTKMMLEIKDLVKITEISDWNVHCR